MISKSVLWMTYLSVCIFIYTICIKTNLMYPLTDASFSLPLTFNFYMWKYLIIFIDAFKQVHVCWYHDKRILVQVIAASLLQSCAFGRREPTVAFKSPFTVSTWSNFSLCDTFLFEYQSFEFMFSLYYLWYPALKPLLMHFLWKPM